MEVSLLEQFLVGELFAFLLIFCRIGTGIMLLPGIGEAYVSTRFRLHIALLMSLLVTPLLSDRMPEVPGSPLTLFVLILAEVLIGAFLGFLSRLLVSTLHITGTIIAFQSSLAMAAIFDINQTGQSTVIGNFLTLSAVVLFFAMDLHHLMLTGLVDSYSLFTPGEFPVVGDMSQHLMRTMSRVFTIAVQLASPHIIFAILFYLGSGVLARLMPNMQVFFVMMPPQIVTAFFLLLATFTSIMLYYAEFVESSLLAFLEQ